MIAALRSTNPADDLPALLAAVETAERTAFPTRARAIATQIREYRPAVFGVSEAWKIDIDLPMYERSLHQDFLPVLAEELRALGLPYQVVSVIEGSIIQPFEGVSLIDRGAILVDQSRVDVKRAESGHFANNLGQVGPGVLLRQGWVSILTEMHGDAYKFVAARLEAGVDRRELRARQAGELVAVVEGEAPVVVMGDFNDTPESPMYRVLEAAHLYDGWKESNPGKDGLTCCHLPNLANPVSRMTRRLDYVFMRGFETPGGVEFPCEMRLFGLRTGEKFPGPVQRLWPSDHAAVMARIIGTRQEPHPE